MARERYCTFGTFAGTAGLAIRFFRPRRELRGIVTRIYSHESPAADVADPRWLIVPDGDIKLIFPVRGAIACSIGDKGRLHRPSRIIVSGMRNEPGRLAFPDEVDAIGVILAPESAYRVLPMPMHELHNGTFDGEELFGAAARAWQQRFMDHARLEDRVAAIQAVLVERLHQRRTEPLVEHAVRRLRASAGRLRIEGLARDLGWSRRQLDRRFLEHVGVGPKALAGVLRFHAVYKMVRSAPAGPLDRIYDYYYDQAHFLKAFKRYAGSAPRRFREQSDYGRLYIPD